MRKVGVVRHGVSRSTILARKEMGKSRKKKEKKKKKKKMLGGSRDRNARDN